MLYGIGDWNSKLNTEKWKMIFSTVKPFFNGQQSISNNRSFVWKIETENSVVTAKQRIKYQFDTNRMHAKHNNSSHWHSDRNINSTTQSNSVHRELNYNFYGMYFIALFFTHFPFGFVSFSFRFRSNGNVCMYVCMRACDDLFNRTVFRFCFFSYYDV